MELLVLVRSSSQYRVSASVFVFGLAFRLAFGRIEPVLFVPSPGVKNLLRPFLGHGHGG